MYKIKQVQQVGVFFCFGVRYCGVDSFLKIGLISMNFSKDHNKMELGDHTISVDIGVRSTNF
jgi:hypothetical protein